MSSVEVVVTYVGTRTEDGVIHDTVFCPYAHSREAPLAIFSISFWAYAVDVDNLVQRIGRVFVDELLQFVARGVGVFLGAASRYFSRSVARSFRVVVVKFRNRQSGRPA